MPLVLALEPDGRQAEALERVVSGRAGARFVLADSKDAALAAIRAEVPDLILLTALLSPRDEAEIADLIRDLDGAEHTQTLTIPMLDLGSPRPAKKKKRGLLSALTGEADTQAAPAGCDPNVFADEIANYLQQAEHLKAEAVQARARRASKPKRRKKEAPATPASGAAEGAAGSSSSYWSWDAPLQATGADADLDRAPAADAEPAWEPAPPVPAALQLETPDPIAEGGGERAPAPDAPPDQGPSSWDNPWDVTAPSIWKQPAAVQPSIAAGDLTASPTPEVLSPVEALDLLLQQPAPVTAADEVALAAPGPTRVAMSDVSPAADASSEADEPVVSAERRAPDPTDLAPVAAGPTAPPVAAEDEPAAPEAETEPEARPRARRQADLEPDVVLARLPTRAESGALLALQADLARLRQQRASTDTALTTAKAAHERAARAAAEAAERARLEAERRAEQAAARALEEARAERRAREQAEQRAREEAERRAETERKAREATERAREEAARQARLEAERRVEAERKAREEAERRAQAERLAREEAERRAKEETARLEREAQERRRHAEAERKAREAAEAHAAAERKAREQAERRAREEAERSARDAERKAREQAERLAKEAEQRAIELAERKAAELAERRAAELAERKATELAERAERAASEKAEKLARRAERKARAEAEALAREVEARARAEAAAERRAREQAERRAEAERQARLEMERRAEQERLAREKAEHLAREQAERAAAGGGARAEARTVPARRKKKASQAPSRSRKDQKPRAVQDEWGLYDPNAAGFEALFARLEAIEESRRFAPAPARREGPRPLALWAFRFERADDPAPAGEHHDEFRALVSQFSIPHAVAAVSYASGARIRKVRVRQRRVPADAPDPDARVVILSRKALEAARRQPAAPPAVPSA